MMFLVVNRKHFAKIFKCTFMSKQLHKLINDHSIKNILNIDAKNELIDFDIRDMNHLIKCFEMYCQIILELTLESIYKNWTKSFSSIDVISMFYWLITFSTRCWFFTKFSCMHESTRFKMISKSEKSSINVWKTIISFVAIETLRTTNSKTQNSTNSSKKKCHTTIANVSIMISSVKVVFKNIHVSYINHLIITWKNALKLLKIISR